MKTKNLIDFRSECLAKTSDTVTYDVKQNYIRNKFWISCHSKVQHYSILMVWFLSSGDKESFSLKVYKACRCFKTL